MVRGLLKSDWNPETYFPGDPSPDSVSLAEKAICMSNTALSRSEQANMRKASRKNSAVDSLGAGKSSSRAGHSTEAEQAFSPRYATATERADTCPSISNATCSQALGGTCG